METLHHIYHLQSNADVTDFMEFHIKVCQTFIVLLNLWLYLNMDRIWIDA